MARKRWTAQTEVTDTLIKTREKKKWQLGFRRYVIEKMPSEAYAPYFGLDIETLRHWFEIQFTGEQDWDNFGKAWQFDHLIPTSYFDYNKEEDLQLCWHFINIRVAAFEEGKPIRTIELLTVRSHFEALYQQTGYSVCKKMLDKIADIENAGIESNNAIEAFLVDHKQLLDGITQLDKESFQRLNQGSTVAALLLEREILRKFGSRE